MDLSSTPVSHQNQFIKSNLAIIKGHNLKVDETKAYESKISLSDYHPLSMIPQVNQGHFLFYGIH